MARHESEMHRQRRELLEALKAIEHSARCASGGFLKKDQLLTLVQRYAEMARAAIKAVEPPCDEGLFGDRRQLDLADRKDLTDRSK